VGITPIRCATTQRMEPVRRGHGSSTMSVALLLCVANDAYKASTHPTRAKQGENPPPRRRERTRRRRNQDPLACGQVLQGIFFSREGNLERRKTPPALNAFRHQQVRRSRQAEVLRRARPDRAVLLARHDRAADLRRADHGMSHDNVALARGV